MPSPAKRPCLHARHHHRLLRSRRRRLSRGHAHRPGVPVSAGADGPPPCLTLTHARRSVAALASQGRLHVSCGHQHRLSHTSALPVTYAHPPASVGVAHLTHAHVCHGLRLCLSHSFPLSHSPWAVFACVTFAHASAYGVVTGPGSTCHLYAHTHRSWSGSACCAHTHVYNHPRAPVMGCPCRHVHAHTGLSRTMSLPVTSACRSGWLCLSHTRARPLRALSPPVLHKRARVHTPAGQCSRCRWGRAGGRGSQCRPCTTALQHK